MRDHHQSGEPDTPSNYDFTRRKFILTSSSAAALTTLPVMSEAQEPAVQPETTRVSMKVNGKLQQLEVDTRTTLLDALREHLHLTGTKKGCDHGQCGACTVIADGRRINSCLSLAVMHRESEITTIEGLGTPENMHPLQSAFVKCDSYQCGFCTSGQICSATAMLRELEAGIPSHVTPDLNVSPAFSGEEIRERMSGNICRCGAYSNIIDAINEAAPITA